ncbi:TIGR03546 family protein [Treponema sp.]|uniref:TIGR03546 family protein n=1 Tax=Treponema sp. TaxID=166 RepID=UPI00388E410B
MLKPIVKLFKALNANVNPGEIAHAFSFGVLLGLMPKNNLLWALVFVFVLFIRINKPMYLIMLLIASTLSPLFGSLFDTVGYAFLTIPAFSDFFADLLEVPFVGFTKFNNSVVMGSLLCGIVLYIPMYILGRLFVFLWRKYITHFVRKLKIAKAVSKLPLLGKIAGMVAGE